MLKECEQRTDGQRLLKQLRDHYGKSGHLLRQPKKNIPPTRAMYVKRARSPQSEAR